MHVDQGETAGKYPQGGFYRTPKLPKNDKRDPNSDLGSQSTKSIFDRGPEVGNACRFSNFTYGQISRKRKIESQKQIL